MGKEYASFLCQGQPLGQMQAERGGGDVGVVAREEAAEVLHPLLAKATLRVREPLSFKEATWPPFRRLRLVEQEK